MQRKETEKNEGKKIINILLNCKGRGKCGDFEIQITEKKDIKYKI